MISKSIQNELEQAARTSLALLSSLSAVTYTAEAVITPTEWASVAASQLDPDSALLKALAPGSYPVADVDDLAREFLFFAYVAGPPGDTVVLLSKFNPSRGLRRKKTFRFVDEQLTEIDEPVLAFDPARVDLIFMPGGPLAALNVGVFEFLLRDAPEIMAKTPSKVAELATQLPMSPGSADKLSDVALRDSRVRRRLLAIVERGHLASASITDVKKELTSKGYTVSEYVNGGKIMVTEANASALLQVLNEDVLRGAFSHDRFAAERKAPA